MLVQIQSTTVKILDVMQRSNITLHSKKVLLGKYTAIVSSSASPKASQIGTTQEPMALSINIGSSAMQKMNSQD